MFAASGRRRRNITAPFFIGLGHRGLFLACHRIQPQSLCIFFFFFLPFFPFDKASYPSQSGKPGELRPPIDGDMARLHRFSAVIQASSSSDLLSKPRSDRIACGIRQPSIASQSLRSPPPSPKPSHLAEMTILLCFPAPVERLKCELAR